MERRVPGFDVWTQGVGFVFDFLGRRYFELDLFLVTMFWFFFLDFADDELFVLEFLFGRKAVFDYSVFVSFLRSLTTIHPYENHSFLLLTPRINAAGTPPNTDTSIPHHQQDGQGLLFIVIAININYSSRETPKQSAPRQPNPTTANNHSDLLNGRPAVNSWRLSKSRQWFGMVDEDSRGGEDVVE